MTQQDARREVVAYWTEKAGEALSSAEAEFAAGRHSFAVNRAYYACFYALSSVLLGEDLRFVKHSGVRAALPPRAGQDGPVGGQVGALL